MHRYGPRGEPNSVTVHVTGCRQIRTFPEISAGVAWLSSRDTNESVDAQINTSQCAKSRGAKASASLEWRSGTRPLAWHLAWRCTSMTAMAKMPMDLRCPNCGRTGCAMVCRRWPAPATAEVTTGFKVLIGVKPSYLGSSYLLV